MVSTGVMPRTEHTDRQTADANCRPRSEVMRAGTPKREIQPEKRALAQSAAEIEETGIASNHLVERSTMVKR